jgi:hypothetical protein
VSYLFKRKTESARHVSASKTLAGVKTDSNKSELEKVLQSVTDKLLVVAHRHAREHLRAAWTKTVPTTTLEMLWARADPMLLDLVVRMREPNKAKRINSLSDLQGHPYRLSYSSRVEWLRNAANWIKYDKWAKAAVAAAAASKTAGAAAGMSAAVADAAAEAAAKAAVPASALEASRAIEGYDGTWVHSDGVQPAKRTPESASSIRTGVLGLSSTGDEGEVGRTRHTVDWVRALAWRCRGGGGSDVERRMLESVFPLSEKNGVDVDVSKAKWRGAKIDASMVSRVARALLPDPLSAGNPFPSSDAYKALVAEAWSVKRTASGKFEWSPDRVWDVLYGGSAATSEAPPIISVHGTMTFVVENESILGLLKAFRNLSAHDGEGEEDDSGMPSTKIGLSEDKAASFYFVLGGGLFVRVWRTIESIEAAAAAGEAGAPALGGAAAGGAAAEGGAAGGAAGGGGAAGAGRATVMGDDETA